MSEKRIGFFYGIPVFCLLLMLCALPGLAESAQDYVISGRYYVLPSDSDYDYTETYPVNHFFYGDDRLGELHLAGAIENSNRNMRYSAYGASGALSLQFKYDGAYLKTDKESWHIDKDRAGEIRNKELGFLNSVGKGCIMIEKSLDAREWEYAIDPITNYFNKEKDESSSLIFTIPESDFMNGMYYRVVVAYKFARRTHAGFLSDEYEAKKCVEVYEFYVASENNYVTFHDMGNGSGLMDQASTDTGFMIRKNGSQDVVTVNGYVSHDYSYFVDPGEYIINITTKLGTVYSFHLTVTNGISFTPLEPKTYESEKDKSFPLEKSVTHPAFGTPLTALSIAVPDGTSIKQVDDKYGVTGKSVSLYLKLNHGIDNLGSGWVLSPDRWGKSKKQSVCNTTGIGEVGTGALIIQTSHDGKNWTNVDNGRYADGLYTTDYANHYGKAETVMIYTPKGQEVINGIHIRVLFAYQVNQPFEKEYRDYVESYQFYLCNDNLGAVTFHNLSVEDTLEDIFTDLDQNTVEIYKQAESLESGSYTATGFQIDKSKNPTVRYTVLHDGNTMTNSSNRFDKTGKYDITLTSAVGSKREVTIYVDRHTNEEAMQLYFGEGFITDKRIFGEGAYPIFEAGETSFHISGVDNNTLPLFGNITNLITGSEIQVEQSPDEKTDIISEPGEYRAVFATSEKYFTGELAGDARVFTFHFRVIPQGTAPGPHVNQEKLKEFSHMTVTDCNPIYYGLKYSSAGTGDITRVFATQDSALQFAYNFENGKVEQQDDGTYRYTGSFDVNQKTKFESNWDLTDAVYFFAEAAVQKHYFDMSDEFTYLSLTPEVLEANPNLKQLALPRSVTIFADGQKEILSDIDALPLLNDKHEAFLNPENGEPSRDDHSFEFVKDQYGGIDSKSVSITDREGVSHAIRYSESVGQQLEQENCPSGIVTIHEETKYGDSVEYQAMYIAPDDIQTELTLAYMYGKEEKYVTYKGSNEGPVILADSFRITELSDPLDPYALIIVSHNRHEDFFTVKEGNDTVWSEPGEYTIKCVNRLGSNYTVLVSVIEPDGKPVEAASGPNNTSEPAGIDALIEQPTRLPSNDTEGKPTLPPETTSKGNDTGNNRNPVIMIVIAGVILLLILLLFAYRRIRLFTQMTGHKMSREEDKHAK